MGFRLYRQYSSHVTAAFLQSLVPNIMFTFDDIHAHSVCIQKAQLKFPTMRKRSETIWYSFIALILALKSKIDLYSLNLLIIRKFWKFLLECCFIVYFFKEVSVYANRLLLWEQICDATGCFVKALPMGQNIVLDKSYTIQFGQISILEHCKWQYYLARFSQFKIIKKQTQQVFEI